MAGKKNMGENGKKASGNQQKQEAAAAKAAAQQQVKATDEAADWGKGAKSSAKKDAEAAKKTEQARKKAEKDALLAEEEKANKAAPKGKVAPKKPARGLDLNQLDAGAGTGAGAGEIGAAAIAAAAAGSLNATGIDNALDVLSLTGAEAAKIDKHPERRFKAAFAAYEERRLAEMDADGSGQGLRQNQKRERIKKEFERSAENPFNQVSVAYDATKEDVAEAREREKRKVEERLGN